MTYKIPCDNCLILPICKRKIIDNIIISPARLIFNVLRCSLIKEVCIYPENVHTYIMEVNIINYLLGKEVYFTSKNGKEYYIKIKEIRND